MAEIDKLVKKLHPLERKVLKVLPKYKNLEEIKEHSELKEVEIMRALQWLQNKDVLKIKKDTETKIVLGKNGEKYIKEGLPEKRLLEILDKEKSMELNDLFKKLERNEVNIAIGLLRSKGAIEINKANKKTILRITNTGKTLLKKETLEENFLKNKFPLSNKNLTPQERYAYGALKKRKDIVKEKESITVNAEISETGKKLLKKDLKEDYVDELTPEMLKKGSWKNKKFRAYDIEAQVPFKEYGKKHFQNQVIEYIKKIWLELGFKEMQGSLVQSAFWDMDALFVPQDHPARELQDTFYVEGKAKIDKKIMEKIKQVHEKGTEKSKGWDYNWSEKEAEKLLLRTHNTVLSARTIAKLKKEDLPQKFFSVGRVFRNEVLDWKHLFEFYQVEGIVVSENVNFRHLLGYLKEFYKKMGYDKVRIRPAYFPYTEPSAEVEVYDENRKQWIELGGSGIFRPEVTKPLLGFECPVLAWGLGLERIIVPYFNMKDLREINKNDLEQLKKIKRFME
ncbi:phenylalanine--tRNA ligase subunit alpha [Candidatus Woesearchaeota archaeon]|nr:phenylalanine--tRNA ligase subunit alpha [Candidatus Woesearchaeota archaeon]